MQKLLKFLLSPLLVPLTRFYLRKERRFRYRDTTVIVFPGVFHPGLFSSTLFLLSYLQKQHLSNKKLLDLGSGSGLISVACAKAGALVTAADLSVRAVENTKTNLRQNGVDGLVLHSNLFDALSPTSFDWIVINPPYYNQDPQTEEELAWKCGVNFEYFEKLFSQLGSFTRPETEVIMVLTKGCDLEQIFAIAARHKFALEKIAEKNVLFDEKDFLYRIAAN